MKRGNLISYAFTPVLASQDVSLAATYMMKSPFPKLPNFFLDSIQLAPEISFAYGLSFPHFRIGNIEITS